ncbi:MAG: 23S rRNA pseudouridine(2605) synthase RluB, partial [Pseudomonadales bacterium]|nr:23S rRNA pseudouridine(2605) synthase RluB [Pseudomonadales bacterium]
AQGEGANRWYYVCLMEGRNREVRRLWESEGIKVNRLKRVRFGPVFMPSRLKVGQWEYLEQKDVDVIYDLVGLPKRKVSLPSKQQKTDQERQQRRKPRR